MITAPFKQGSAKMKVFKHLKGWINQLATCPETVEEHNFCKKEIVKLVLFFQNQNFGWISIGQLNPSLDEHFSFCSQTMLG